MLFIEEISVTKIKSASRDKAEYASHIPADRLIHIMRFGKEMSAFEWDILESMIGGETIVNIAERYGVNERTIRRHMKKLSIKMSASVLG